MKKKFLILLAGLPFGEVSSAVFGPNICAEAEITIGPPTVFSSHAQARGEASARIDFSITVPTELTLTGSFIVEAGVFESSAQLNWDLTEVGQQNPIDGVSLSKANGEIGFAGRGG
jgi:hypothetical protein